MKSYTSKYLAIRQLNTIQPDIVIATFLHLVLLADVVVHYQLA